MSRASKIVLILAALLLCVGASSSAMAQWSGTYSTYGTSVGGGVTGGYYSPYGWSHTGLGWASVGVGENTPYHTGITAGFGPSGGGAVGVTLPGLGSYDFTW